MTVSPWASTTSSYVAAAPAFLTLGQLRDDETVLANSLVNQLVNARPAFDASSGFYDGSEPVRSLGISVPSKLEGLQTILGWGRLCVDAIAERLQPVGMRWPGDVDADLDLWGLWQDNNLDEEAALAHVDALSMGSGFLTVGTADEEDASPIIAVESPLAATTIWDARTRKTKAGFRAIKGATADSNSAVLYLPDETITLQQTSTGWVVVDRDEHDLGRVPMVRMANRQRSHDRTGYSEITPEVRSIVKAAARTMLQLQVASEFYSAPQRYVLGAAESAFQDANGNTRSAWETYIGRYLALERDEEGEVPTVGSFPSYSPQPYTEVLTAYARLVSSETGLPPHYFGWAADNPTSADAINASEYRLVRRVQDRQVAFGGAWEEAVRLALLLRDGDLPPEASRLETVWAPAATPTLAATTDALVKQVQAGIVPAESDVVTERLGYSPTDQARLASDRQTSAGSSALLQAVEGARAAQAAVPPAGALPAGQEAPVPAVAGGTA